MIRNRNQIINEVIQNISMKDIDLLGFINQDKENQNPHNPLSDLDILIIFKKPLYNNPTNSRRLYNLTQSINQILAETPKILVYPSFRFEILLRYFRFKDAIDIIPLHLLVYPSLEQFILWENVHRVQSMLATANVEKGTSKLFTLRKKTEKPQQLKNQCGSFFTDVQYLHSLLYETYILANCSRLKRKIIKLEVIHKTTFVIKYLTWEALNHLGFQVDELLTWRHLMKNLIHLEKSNIDTEIVRIAWKLKKSISLKTIKEADLLDKTFVYFDGLLRAFSK